MKKFILFLLLCVSLSFAGCSSKSVKHGDIVTISKKCIVASTETDYDVMTEHCNHRDEASLELMKEQGRIEILQAGATGRVTEMGFDKIKIRLLDGREFWCGNDFVK